MEASGRGVKTIAGHELIIATVKTRYRPYDRLVLREGECSRSLWTVLDCEKAGESWSVTAIRCPKDCRIHGRKR